ncbi:MAG: hypothetical protein ACXVSF_06465 [Solirubrobacteraceae bacterium]
MSESFANNPRPLDQVLAQSLDDFTPQAPNRAPWARMDASPCEHASTGNVVTVPLIVADRVHLRNLDRPSYEQDWETGEPTDWTPLGWGVSATP